MQQHDLYHDVAGLRIARIVLNAGETIPMHRHSKATEWLQCEQGELLLRLSDKHCQRLQAGEHESIAPGQAHALKNASDQPAAFLLVQSGQHDFLQMATVSDG